MFTHVASIYAKFIGTKESVCIRKEFNSRRTGYLDIPHLWHTVLAGGWKFVGASYDHSTGDANLWVNGAVVYTRNIGIGLDLATNDSIRMGAYDQAYFKGRIAQMQVYDKALTQEQIQAIQQQTEVVCEYVSGSMQVFGNTKLVI